MKTVERKLNQLGVPFGTATSKLRRDIMFHLLKKCNEDICFRCGNKIYSSKEMSIDHKVPYLDMENALDLFFDIHNITFSHLKCNVAARRMTHKIESLDDSRIKHGSPSAYRRGCRCEPCKTFKNNDNRKLRDRKKLLT